MSKRNKAVFARDLRPGDTIRLVYEISVTSIDDLDTKLPCESDDLFFIKGNVVKGPLRGRSGEFAISGGDKLDVRLRRTFWNRLKDRFANWAPTPDKRRALSIGPNVKVVAAPEVLT